MHTNAIPHSALDAIRARPRAAARRTLLLWLLQRLRAWRMEAELALVEPRLLEDAGIPRRSGATPHRSLEPVTPRR